jgi:hypothetical protein
MYVDTQVVSYLWEGDPHEGAMVGGGQFDTDAEGSHGGIQQIRLEHGCPGLPVVLGRTSHLSHHRSEQEPAPVPDPGRWLMSASQPCEDVIATYTQDIILLLLAILYDSL